jgi:predicted sugar kinase
MVIIDPLLHVLSRYKRPIRVAARRKRELMVIIANSENGPEDAEWIEENELDLSGRIPGYPVEANNTSVPLIALLMIIMLVHGKMFLFNNCINPLKSVIWQPEKYFASLIFNMSLQKMIQRMLTF